MQNTKYRQQIIDEIQPYIDELNKEDFSHDFNHILRVERLAKRIAEEEHADIEIIEASSLIFDIARLLEDRGECEDHAIKGAEIAQSVLNKINFPQEKIEKVCHCIIAHRRSKDRIPETLEAKIIEDADRLDAMGAINLIRAVSSALLSKQYRKPIFIDVPYSDELGPNYSYIHYLEYQIRHPKHQPEYLNTNYAKILAKERTDYVKEFIFRFRDEWNGIR